MSENTQAKLGKLIEAEEYRDAVHIAVAPIVAARRLSPGQHVGLDMDGKASGNAEPPIGVVDPFLRQVVVAGETFWLFLYPNTITALRHEWTHPAFLPAPPPNTEPMEKALAWFRGREDDYGFETQALIRAVVSNEGYCFGDDDGPEWARSNDFWRHLEEVTGRQFGEDARENTYFRCAC